MGIGRPNSRSVDILEQIVKVLFHSLNPVILQSLNLRTLKKKAVVGEGRGASFQPTPHFTPIG